jgi:hypothetical protein
MPSRRDFLVLTGAGLGAGAGFAAGTGRSWAQAAAPKFTAKIGHLESPLQPRHRGLEKVSSLVKERTKGEVADWNVNWIVFLLIVNVILLIAGMFVDPNSILLVLIPTFYPVAVALGIDPVHFGLIVCLNICIGMITPPFGLDLFVASSTLRRPVEAVIAGVWPFIATNIIVLVLITYIPQISTAILKITR